nr:hypothetical protein [uncultured Albidiferax sp.]
MAYTANIGITKLVPGQSSAHVVVNDALDVVDKALAGRLALDLSGLTTKALTGGESTNSILHITTTTAACTLTVQAVPKVWQCINDGAHAVTVQCTGQTGAPVLAVGVVKTLVCDGTKVRVVA